MRALLLDDDEYALDYLRAVLLERYPDLEVEARLHPDVTGDFDIYFLDDDFEGIRLAGKLARTVRATNPTAIILAFSASLEPATLRDLLDAGCSGVCDKKVPADTVTMLDTLGRSMDELEAARSRRRPERTRLVATLRKLFRAWNERLDRQE
jgi:DNA-binding NarL/FixJ family response regulator